jgi:hypothetical protein
LAEAKPDERGLSFTHEENPYEDYRHQSLLPHMLARLGPALACGDVNGNGREDVFVGGAKGQSATLFVQRGDGSFDSLSVEAFEADASFEDVAATFVDVDGDGSQDLYVVSGGTWTVRAESYQDRVYLNDGSGTFSAAPDVLPTIESSGGAVAARDFDGDGDQDLFVGGRVRSMEYPLSPRSYLLENEDGTFTDVTAQAADELQRPGMVTDARWHDLTADGSNELILSGEWMSLRVFRHDGAGAFTEITGDLGLEQSNGWWNEFAIADFDGDGDADLVAGNRGWNHQVQARPDAPASLYAGDLDQDGDIEPIMSHYQDGTEHPVPRRDRLVDALSLFRARFQTYESYAEATMNDVLTEGQWERAQRFKVHTFTTSIFEQEEDGTFERHDLPAEAQFSSTHGIVVHDVTDNGRPDLLLAGNDFTVRRPWGPSKAGHGALLVNQGTLDFTAQRARESGFFAPRDVRSLLLVPTLEGPLLIVGNNDESIDLFELKSEAISSSENFR